MYTTSAFKICGEHPPQDHLEGHLSRSCSKALQRIPGLSVARISPAVVRRKLQSSKRRTYKRALAEVFYILTENLPRPRDPAHRSCQEIFRRDLVKPTKRYLALAFHTLSIFAPPQRERPARSPQRVNLRSPNPAPCCSESGPKSAEGSLSMLNVRTVPQRERSDPSNVLRGFTFDVKSSHRATARAPTRLVSMLKNAIRPTQSDGWPISREELARRHRESAPSKDTKPSPPHCVSLCRRRAREHLTREFWREPAQPTSEGQILLTHFVPACKVTTVRSGPGRPKGSTCNHRAPNL